MLYNIFLLSRVVKKHVIKHTFSIVRNTTRKLYEIQLLLHSWSAFCNKYWTKWTLVSAVGKENFQSDFLKDFERSDPH